MKTYFSSKTLIALAVAVAVAAGYESLANEQPIPPPANDSALPASIQPGTPVAQVVKLVQAGVDAAVIQTYISNCPSAFNLDADKIISLTDAGVPSDMVNAMFTHDKAYLSSLATAAPVAQPSSPAPVPVASSDNPPPPPTAPTDANLNEINQTLTPYGSWVEVEGYGRCWRPSVVIYDSTWQPYCDHGQWVYTDCGWYWNSDYAWGVTFHYGRWFSHPHYGWCWWPDTVWAPSWVTWRSSGDYCGWAPLPPFTAYQPGIGFTYRGNNVAVSFGFGLAANCFTFVSIGHFCEPHPRYYCVPRQQVTQIYNQTTVINNFNHNNRTIVNNGVSVTVIGNAAHHPIQAVPVGTLVNGGRRVWNGGGMSRPARPFGADASGGSATRNLNLSSTELNHGPVWQNGGNHDPRPNTDATGVRRPTISAPPQTVNRGGENTAPAHSQQTPQAPGSRNVQNQSGFAGGNFNSPTQPAQSAPLPASHNPAPVTIPGGNQPRNDWQANGGDYRQPMQQVAPPNANDRPRLIAPRYMDSYTPRHVAPATPVQPATTSKQPQNAGNSVQGGTTRNH